MPWRKFTCRPTRGGRVDPGCGDPDPRTGVIRLSVIDGDGQFADIRYPVTHGRLHTCWRSCMMGQIFDHEETVMGLRPAATYRLRECGRAMTRRPGQFTDLRYPVTPTLAHKLARAFDGQVFDHPKTVMGLRRLARTVCEGVTARWRDGVESFPTFGIQSHRCLHACWRGRSMEQIFDH